MDISHPRGTIALVTGGYKHIGYTVSRELKGAGFEVVATYRTDAALAHKAASSLGMAVRKADMSREEDVCDLFSELEAEGKAVGVLVNNVSSFPRGPVLSTSPSEMREAFESTYFASFYAIRMAVPRMKDRGYGRIINMGMAGLGELKGYTEVAVHASAKTALSVLTLSLARELSSTGITVNMVAPGVVDRPEWDDAAREAMRRRTRLHTIVPPEEVARAVAYLVSREDMNGRIIEVTGRFDPGKL